MIRPCLTVLLLTLGVGTTAQHDLWSTWNNSSLDDSTRVVAMHDLIWEDFMFYDADSAYVLATELVEFADSAGLEIMAAKTMNLQGVSSYFIGNHVASLRYYFKALDVFEKHQDLNSISSVNNNIGNVYHEHGKMEKALKHYRISKEIDEQVGDIEGVAGSLCNIGSIIQDEGRVEEALEDYLLAVRLLKDAELTYGLSIALYDVADALLELGRFDEAIAYFDESVAFALADQDLMMAATGYAGLGHALYEEDRLKEAIVSCTKALEYSQEYGALMEEKMACDCLYLAYKAQGDGIQALAFNERKQLLDDSLKTEETLHELQQIEFDKQLMEDSLKRAEENLRIEMEHQSEVNKKERSRNLFLGLGLLLLVLAVGLFSRVRYVRKAKNRIEKEKDRSENLLLNILPAEIAEELKEKGEAAARDFELVSILFTDFKGFTEASEKLSAADLVEEINTCFKAFDEIVGRYEIEKIKTIGDAYMAAGGLPIPDQTAVVRTVKAALEMQSFMKQRKAERDNQNLPAFDMRVGIHTGPVVAGIVGVKKFQYDIWGDTVNTASRMESSGEVGKVNISEETYELLKDQKDFVFESRGEIEAKGKGALNMYFVH